MFCKMFSESSQGRLAVLQLPCCPCKQGKLSENIVQNLWNKLLIPRVLSVVPRSPARQAIQSFTERPGLLGKVGQQKVIKELALLEKVLGFIRSLFLVPFSIQGYSSCHGKGFVKCFLRVPQAVGLYCSCHVPQASKETFQKTCYKTFPMT